MITIRALNKKDCNAVAKLHMQALRTPFVGKAGEKLLDMYYAAVVAGKGAAGYVAKSSEGHLMGFVCGVWQAGLLRNEMLKRYGPGLFFWGGIQVVQRPKMLTSLPERLKRRDTVQNTNQPGYELRPIVVAENARGSGVANKLVQILLQDAQQRGFTEVYLYTERDNLAARKFYAKVGFIEAGRESRFGLTYLQYLCNLKT